MATQRLLWSSAGCSKAFREEAAERVFGLSLDVLKWFRANGCPWDKWTCAKAAGNGHLEVLKRARVNGCPWDETTCAYTAKLGQREALEWARTNHDDTEHKF